MTVMRPALVCLAILTSAVLAQRAAAQKLTSVGVSRPAASAPPAAPPTRGGGTRGGGDGGYHGGGRFGGWGGVATGVIGGVHSALPPDRVIDDGDDGYDPPPPPSRRQAQTAPRRNSNAPPAGERRLVPDEVVIELRNSATPAQIDALQRRFRLARISSTPLGLPGATFYRWRIPARRAVAAVVRQLEADRLVASAQPNYQFQLQQAEAKSEGEPAQYELAKLHLPQAHALAKGGRERVAVIASAGNAGPKSPPLYPAADADVIAVTGTDAQDKVIAVANRGRHIAVAAPGAELGIAAFASEILGRAGED